MDARVSDFLDLHDNVARRVRNLETGVHPLRALADWQDSIPPTLFNKDPGGSSSLTPVTAADNTMHPRYQKRSGIGALMGQIHAVSDGLTGDTGGLYGTLPEPMRPTQTHGDLVFYAAPPYTLRVTVQPDGQVRVKAGAGGSTAELSLDGVTWPVA